MNLTPSLGTGAARIAAPDKRLAIVVRPVARPHVKHDFAGYGVLRSTLEFARWAHEQEKFPSAAAVCHRFNVCRATAYRWTRALAEVYGIDPAVRFKQGQK